MSAGKGDKSRIDPKVYGLGRYWWRSKCCGERVRGIDSSKVLCRGCGKSGPIRREAAP